MQEDFQVQILLQFEIVFISCSRNSKMKLIFAFALIIVVAAASNCENPAEEAQAAMEIAGAVNIIFLFISLY